MVFWKVLKTGLLRLQTRPLPQPTAPRDEKLQYPHVLRASAAIFTTPFLEYARGNFFTFWKRRTATYKLSRNVSPSGLSKSKSKSVTNYTKCKQKSLFIMRKKCHSPHSWFAKSWIENIVHYYFLVLNNNNFRWRYAYLYTRMKKIWERNRFTYK